MLSPLDLYEIEYYSEPTISPDGSKVLFVQQSCDIQTDQRYFHLWMIDSDGSKAHPITKGPRQDYSPCFAPDGKRFAFLSTMDGKTQIYVWDGAVRQLTELDETPSGISWSPNGSQIAFTKLVPESPAPIAQLPKCPRGATWAEAPRQIEIHPYFADGSGFLQPGTGQIFVVDSAGGTPRQITWGKAHLGKASWFFNPIPRWVPDGKQFITPMLPNKQCPRESQIYKVSAEDGSSVQLTPDSLSATCPVISPNGQWIAFVGFELEQCVYKVRNLYVMDLDGKALRCLSEKLDRTIHDPQWASDSKTLCFFYDDHGVTKLGAYTLDGCFRCLARDLGGNGLAYGGTIGGAGYSLADDNTFAFNSTRPDLPCALCVGHLDRKGCETILTCSLGRQMGSAEEMCFTSRLDGLELQGWILKPPHFSPDKQWPLLLHVHGGPMTNFGERFDIEHQMWACAGYVVLYVNYRGSTSYGERFARLIDRSFPLGVEEDLHAAVDAILEKGYIDPKQLFITGPSAGGCLTCWTVGLSDRFRAAAASYPVTNWAGMMLTGDIPYFIPQMFEKMPWEDPDSYLKRSPIIHVGKVFTPTLVLCGEKDHRTPMAQAEQFYQALALRGVESALIRFPDEPHGVRVRPSHQLAKILYIQGWFDRYAAAG